MKWTDLLHVEMENAYRAAEGLINLVDEDKLDWKPTTGNNWMTTGQLLRHIPDACGLCFKGFVTGDWGFPELEGGEPSGESMLPPAEKLPSVASVAEAKERLAKDKELALAMIEQAGEEDLEGRMVTAPWSPEHPMRLGHQLLGMVAHLEMHKNQLYYYLKLQGKPVNTFTMFGMG